MEYLITLLVMVGLYFVIPCKLSDLLKRNSCEDNGEVDGGTYSGKKVRKKAKAVKKKTRKSTSRAKPVAKVKRAKRKSKK